MEQKCRTCRAVAAYFLARVEEDEPGPSSSSRLHFEKGLAPKFYIRWASGDDDDDTYDRLELTLPNDTRLDTSYYIDVDKSWIDLKRISIWSTSCDSKHGGVCHSFPAWKTLELPLQLILVDVEKWCLTLVQQPTRYLALSYVWGRIPDILETTKENFTNLQQIDALRDTKFTTRSRLPKTVNDAIILTKLIGQPYIWIDRLCIIQDDHENKKAQLDAMASIYARSYFTIVAADGVDADHGLRGVPGTVPRHYTQKFYHFSQECKMMEASENMRNLRSKEWHRRGWTFQERTLSNRNLFFFHDRIFWECRTSTCLEDTVEIPSTAVKVNLGELQSHDLQFLRYPDLHQYAKLAFHYNSRLLSFDEDAFNAFSAVLQVLSRSFRGGFHFGLPEYFFDFSLMWIPIVPCEKRNHRFPSWSWLSVAGEMAFLYHNRCDSVVFDIPKFRPLLPPSIKIHAKTMWYTTSEPTGKGRRIGNTYSEHQDMRNPTSKFALPPGWSKHHHHNSNPGLGDDQKGVAYFTHLSIPNQKFIYPVPIADEPYPSTRDPSYAYLKFTTTRRLLKLGSALKGNIETGGRAWSSYYNAEVDCCIICNLFCPSSLRWVGIIRTNVATETALPIGDYVEIIVLSGGNARLGAGTLDIERSRIVEFDLVDDLKYLEIYEFLNVMWIRREKGIAYREAVGRVWKQAWEEQESESLNVVLG